MSATTPERGSLRHSWSCCAAMRGPAALRRESARHAVWLPAVAPESQSVRFPGRGRNEQLLRDQSDQRRTVRQTRRPRNHLRPVAVSKSHWSSCTSNGIGTWVRHTNLTRSSSIDSNTSIRTHRRRWCRVVRASSWASWSPILASRARWVTIDPVTMLGGSAHPVLLRWRTSEAPGVSARTRLTSIADAFIWTTVRDRSHCRFGRRV
jgi:hypothetical protein